MPNLWIVLLTGLTTGGLSCLAVQGGLLANVIGRQAEEELKPETWKNVSDLTQMSKHDLINYYEHHYEQARTSKTFRGDITLSIILFLVAKIVAYTLLGFGLGYLGTAIQLTPFARGVLMLAITVFMIATALRMLNIHPIFNYFQIQPPKFVRTFIRKISRNKKEDFATPVFLGTLTVLIPCGITQAMMALALGTGSPIAGALIMLVFTLGASPVFFLLAYFTTRLGEKLNAQFVKIVAILIIIFGLISLESGLNLVGSPISYANYKQWRNSPVKVASDRPITPTENQTTPKNDTPKPAENQTLKINVVDSGYQPNLLKALANTPTKLVLTTNQTFSCSRAFVVPSLNIQEILPETGTRTINIPAQPSGKLRFMCSMGMYTGNIIFEEEVR